MEASDPVADRTRRQWNSFALYLMSLAMMISLYSVYAKFLVPVIEGPPNIVQRRTADPDLLLLSTSFDKTEILQHLPSDAWERDECKTLVTSQGTILFKNFERLEGGYLEIFPFTLVGTQEPDSAAGSANSTILDPSAPSVSPTPDSTEPLTFLRCLRGARVKFDRSISEAFVGKAKMESAQLIGHVDVVRVPSQPDANDGFLISTSNIQIEKHQVYTIEEVAFEFGLNHGRGKNLSIALSHDSDVNQITGDFSSIQGVKRIELAYLNYIRLVSANPKKLDENVGQDFVVSNAEPSRSSDQFDDARNDEFAGSDDPVNVRCRGPFVMDMDARTAILRDQVTVEFENEFRDRILCDELIIGFEDESASDDSLSVAAQQKSPQKPGKLKLKQLVAIGSPATVVSTERQAKITGQKLIYQTLSRIVIAESSPGQPPVIVVSPDFHVSTARLEYQMSEGRSLGRIDARGPGQLLRAANAERQEFFLSWSDQLLVEPLANSNYQISVIGNANARGDNATRLKSQRIDLLVNEQRVSQRLADGQLEEKSEYRPLKLVAQQNVQIESPQLSGTTRLLTALWPSDSIGSNADPRQNLGRQLSDAGTATGLPHESRKALAAGANRGNANSPASAICAIDFPIQAVASGQSFIVQKPVMGTFQDPPTQPAGGSNTMVVQRHDLQPIRRDRQVRLVNFEAKQPQQDTREITFKGDEVTAKLATVGDETEVQDLTISGNVSVRQTDAAADQPRQIVIEGEFLRLIPQAEKRMRFLVSGTSPQPASVVTQGLSLSGQNIHLDQTANKLWVEGAGNLKINQAANKSDNAQIQPPAQKQNRYQDVNVQWRGGMVFDGNRIYFEDDVLLAATGESKDRQPVTTGSNSEGLSLRLSKSVNFGDVQADNGLDDVEIEEMVTVNRLTSSKRIFPEVTASNSELSFSEIFNRVFDQNGKLLEQQQFLVAQATLNSRSGTVNADGPGVILQYQFGSTKLLSKRPVNAANSTMLDTASTAPQIMMVRVDFDGSADVTANQREMVVRGNVRALYSPVDSFDRVYLPEQSQPLPADAVKLTCEQLKLSEWTPRNSVKPVKDLVATGNAHIISRELEATADRVSYFEQTDNLVIEGTPRSDAHLWFKNKSNARQKDPLVAEKIVYRISDERTEVQGVKNINIDR